MGILSGRSKFCCHSQRSASLLGNRDLRGERPPGTGWHWSRRCRSFFTSYEGHDMAAQEAVKHSETNIHICINNQADTRKGKGTSIEMNHP